MIAASGTYGIRLSDTASGNYVQGNYIGTRSTGSTQDSDSYLFGNGQDGIRIDTGASLNFIGTDGDTRSDLEERNVITYNGASGIFLLGADSSNNRISGNYVGVDVGGTWANGNGRHGIEISGSSFNDVGSDGDGYSDELERNVITGNRQSEMILENGAHDNHIAGNFIGLRPDGISGPGNSDPGTQGILITLGAHHNVIGTKGSDDNPSSLTIPGERGFDPVALRNIISRNFSGVRVEGSDTSANMIAGNFIGVDKNGTQLLGNTHAGVIILAGSHDNIIGTDGDGIRDVYEGNLISGNYRGIEISGAGNFPPHDNTIAGNAIGASGGLALPNNYGVAIFSAHTNTVGGVRTETGNYIAGNTFDAVVINGSDAHDNRVSGNRVGSLLGLGAPTLGNGGSGVSIVDGYANTIGGSGPGQGNVFTVNQNGVSISGPSATGNTVEGNFIGTDEDRKAGIGNRESGVKIEEVSDNRIGGDSTLPGAPCLGDCNVIAGNGAYGIQLFRPGGSTLPVRTDIRGNLMSVTGLGGVAVVNVLGDLDACGSLKATYDPGSDVTLSCGSLVAQVRTGAIHVRLQDGVTASIPAGVSAVADVTNGGTYTIETDSSSTSPVEISVSSDMTVLVPAGGAAELTQEDDGTVAVENSSPGAVQLAVQIGEDTFDLGVGESADLSPRGLVEAALQEISTLYGTPGSDEADRKLSQELSVAAADIRKALDERNWSGPVELEAQFGHKVFDALAQAVVHLSSAHEAASLAGRPDIAEELGEVIKAQLVQPTLILARDAIDTSAEKAKQSALNHYDRALAYKADGRLDKAIKEFGDAWNKARAGDMNKNE